MKDNQKKMFSIAVAMFLVFLLWTILIRVVDVRAIGPQGSAVGFATINAHFHHFTGVHLQLYQITDQLSIIPLGFVIVFGVQGLFQWITRKKLNLVDYNILILGGFYIAVFAAYILFELLAVNYRPILIDGSLEVSYPSSTTMLVICVMPSALMQLRSHIKNAALRHTVSVILLLFTGFMVICRLISGVHWLTDILGGAMLSISLVMMYLYFLFRRKDYSSD